MSLAARLVVVGAGPAGLAAALAAQEAGMAVTVVDQHPAPGGQIYRGLLRASAKQRAALGPEYLRGDRLLADFAACGATLISDAQVWDIDAAGVAILREERCQVLPADQIVLATGAMERPSPLLGWTLPGVMNAGAAQILLKDPGMVPKGRVALVGNGPLLLLLARQLHAAGVKLVAFIDTSTAGNFLRALPHLPRALLALPELAQGLSLLRELQRLPIPCWRADQAPRIEACGSARRVSFLAAGKPRSVDADLVLLHHGVIPNTQLTRLLRLEHEWNAGQVAWRPRTGRWGATARADLRIAGDASGIAGAIAAQAAGRLAGLGAALAAGQLSAAQADRHARPWEAMLRRQQALRPLLEALYAPPHWLLHPADEVTACRCENVSAGQIRALAGIGCRGPNQAKFFSRCGMGPCQGRMCGDTITQLLAEANGLTIEETGQTRIRPPLTPIDLAALATLATEHASDQDSNGIEQQ